MHDLGERPIEGPHGPRDTDALCEQLEPGRFSIDGREHRVPMEIPDSSLLVQLLPVPLRAAAPLLEGTGLRPASLWPGTTVVTLMAVQYRDNPLGDYAEAVISLPALTPGQRAPLLGLDVLRGTVGHFIYAMPVDQEHTAHAGRFIWGYPKFLARIDIELQAASATARFAVDGELIFAIRVPAGERRRVRQTAHNLTLRGGRLRRIQAELEGEGVGFALGGEPPQVGQGPHPLACALRALGLPRRPLFSASVRRVRARFGAAEPLPAAPT